jgi:hypothetical protein
MERTELVGRPTTGSTKRVMTVILVNEPRGYRVCLECHETFDSGDERDWMTRHVACDPEPAPLAA